MKVTELKIIKKICLNHKNSCTGCPFDDLSFCYFESRRPQNWNLFIISSTIRKIKNKKIK